MNGRRVMIDNKQLIALVESNPAIFDRSLPDHRDRDAIANMWTGISQVLGVGVTEIKVRWRSLKDTYIRKQRQRREHRKSGTDEPFKEPKWMWYKQLSFLDQCLDDFDYPEQGDMVSDTEEDLAYEVMVQDHRSELDLAELGGAVYMDNSENDYQESPSPHTSRHASPSPAPSLTSTSIKRSPIWNPGPGPSPHVQPPHKKPRPLESNTTNEPRVSGVFGERDRTRQVVTSSHKEYDSDEMFLLSYAKDLRNLPNSSRSLVKLKIAQLFHEFSNP